MIYPFGSIVRSNYRRSSEGSAIYEEGNGWIKGFLYKRKDIFITASHCNPAPGDEKKQGDHGWVWLETERSKKEWRRIIDVITIPNSDISVCILDKPFTKKAKPLKVGKTKIGKLVAIIRKYSTITYKRIGYISPYHVIGAVQVQGKELIPGDSGLPWLSTGFFTRVVTHSHKGLWGEGPDYSFYKKDINAAYKTLKKRHNR